MAWHAARKLRTVIDNVRRILAVEYVVAARAIDLRRPLIPAAATAALVDLLRSDVEGPGPDRYLAPDLRAAEELLQTDQLVAVANSAGASLG
jgi:histidine ammonia-lyase